MISNNTYYELFASYTVPDHNRVGYWVDLGANSKGKVIKTYNENLKKWVKVTDATSEDAVAPFIGNNGNWWIDNRDTGVSASGQPPFIGNNDNWFTYDSSGNPVDTGKSSKGTPGDKGQDGKGFAILGYYTTLDALQSAISNPSAGDAYGVGSSMPYDIYIYDSVSNSWLNNGAIQGAKGEPGEKGEMGPAGKDATINGLNAINIVEGDNISITQTGNTLTINSEYKGAEIEEVLDKFANGKVGTISAVNTNENVDDPEMQYVTKQELDNALTQAITTTLNTEV